MKLSYLLFSLDEIANFLYCLFWLFTRAVNCSKRSSRFFFIWYKYICSDWTGLTCEKQTTCTISLYKLPQLDEINNNVMYIYRCGFAAKPFNFAHFNFFTHRSHVLHWSYTAHQLTKSQRLARSKNANLDGNKNQIIHGIWRKKFDCWILEKSSIQRRVTGFGSTYRLNVFFGGNELMGKPKFSVHFSNSWISSSTPIFIRFSHLSSNYFNLILMVFYDRTWTEATFIWTEWYISRECSENRLVLFKSNEIFDSSCWMLSLYWTDSIYSQYSICTFFWCNILMFHCLQI